MNTQEYSKGQNTSIQLGVNDRLFTREELAQYLNVGTTFIEKLRRIGKLPSFRLSAKCIRYRKSDCDILLERSLISSPAKNQNK